MASEIGELFSTLRIITEPWSTGWTEASSVAEDATSKIDASALSMAESLGRSSEAAAAAFQAILDAAVRLAEGITEPLNAVKTSVRAVASAIRALGKATAGLDEQAIPAFEEVTTAASSMAASLDTALATSRAAMGGLGAEFSAVAAEATGASAEITAASERSAVAATEAGGAAAASAKRSSLAMGETAGGLMKYATGLAAVGFGVFEAIKSSTSFNAEMTKINTQAGVAKSQLAGLGAGVLDLAGKVGDSPDSLAEALYHVESSFASTGITGSKALDILKTAAEGAAVGHADLVDVTNALDAAIASGIPGVENYSQAMGALNSIVGSGDMQMQDLADAMGTGMVAVVKGYGLSLNDVGAALATFGDNNIRGAKAGTDLRMAVQALADPVRSAGVWLDKFGMTAKTLQGDMQKGGLSLALTDLQNHFKKAGITATQEGGVITDMFGKKAGGGLAVLMGQFGRFESKYPELEKGAKNFSGSWATASHTLAQEFNGLKAGLEALGVKIGTALMPALTAFLGWVRTGVSWITQHKQAVDVLASVLGGVLVAAIFAVGAAITAALPEVSLVTLAIVGIASAVIYAWTHFKPFREVVTDIGNVLKTVFVGAIHVAQTAISTLVSWFSAHKSVFTGAWDQVVKTVHSAVVWFDQNVLTWVKARISDLTSWWAAHSQEISEVWTAIWRTIQTVVKVAWDSQIHPTLVILQAVWKVVWNGIRDTIKVVWAIISGVITAVMHNILNTIAIVLDLVTGHWSKAWQDAKKLVSQGLHDVIHLITSVASGFGTLLYDAGANIIKGLISGIKSMVGGAGSAIKDVANTIRSYLPFSPAKTGPLSGSGSPDLAGAKIGTMVADGITSSTRKVAQAGHGLAGAAALAIGGSGNVGALSVGGGMPGGAAAQGAGGGTLPPIIVQIDRKTLFKILQVDALRYGRRNPTTGLVYQTG